MPTRIPGLVLVPDRPCRADPELFYATGVEAVARAKRICGGCRYRPLCLMTALATDEQLGVWGGLTPEEREAIPPQDGARLLAGEVAAAPSAMEVEVA